MFIGMIFTKLFIRQLLRIFSLKWFLVWNSVLLTGVYFLFCQIDNNLNTYWIVTFLFLYGICVSLQFTGLQTLTYSDVQSSLLSQATSFASTMQNLSKSFAVACSAFSLEIFDKDFHITHDISLSTFHYTFILLALILMISSFLFLKLPPHAGSVVTGYQPIKRRGS